MTDEDIGAAPPGGPGAARRQTALLKAAANVRSALGWRNITASAAAREIGVTQAYLSRRLNGDVPFDVVDLTLLAHLLDLTPGHLLDGEPWPEAATKPAGTEVMSCNDCSFRTTDGSWMAGHCEATGHRQRPY